MAGTESDGSSAHGLRRFPGRSRVPSPISGASLSSEIFHDWNFFRHKQGAIVGGSGGFRASGSVARLKRVVLIA